MLTRIALVSLAVAASAAHAQSINIDFGTPESVPPHSYGAVGRFGSWNSFESLPSYQRFPLVNLHGQPISANIYNYGGTAMLSHNILGTTGGDEALLDDMLLSFNNPVDACIWIEHLVGGTYTVIIYAITPNDSFRMCRTRVDFGSPGPTMVGGTWSGSHQHGVTYASFTVDITDGGTIGLHSGLYNGFIQSGINGIQIIRQGECATDFDGDGFVTGIDFDSYVAAFEGGNDTSDFDGDGFVSGIDFDLYVQAFEAGC